MPTDRPFPLLPSLVWRPAYSTRGAEIPGFRSEVTRNPRLTQVTRHAVRNGRTLCGFPVSAVTWADGQVEYDELTCSGCSIVPEGRVTHYDMTNMGITYRQLDHWVRRGYLKPDNLDGGSGHLRTFPIRELSVAWMMAKLTAAGVTPTAARAARNGGWLTDRVKIAVTEPYWEERRECL